MIVVVDFLLLVAGSGLHTFLLFLGPHIIRVANAAIVCKNVDFSAEISNYLSWRAEYAPDAFTCRKYDRVQRARPSALFCAAFWKVAVVYRGAIVSGVCMLVVITRSLVIIREHLLL